MAGKYFLQQREVSSEFQRFRWTEDQQRVFRQKKVEMTGKLEAGQLFHCTFRCYGESISKNVVPKIPGIYHDHIIIYDHSHC